MKRTGLRLVALLGICLWIVLSAGQHLNAQAKEIVVVKGAADISGLVDSLAKDFMKANPQYTIVVIGGKSWTGLEYLLDGSAQVAMCLRPITAEDREKARAKGMDLAARVIDWGGVAVITDPGNPLKQLSIDQLKDLFTGKYRSWKDVGGPDIPVKVVVAELGQSWVAGYVVDEILKGQQPTRDSTVKRYFDSILRQVATTPWTIGYAPIEKVEKLQSRYPVKVLAVSRTADELAIAASKQTVEDRSYLLIRPFLLVYDGKSKKKGPEKFVEYCAKIRLERR